MAGMPDEVNFEAMKLGDTIIAAAALEYSRPLVTRNEGDFKQITGLVVLNPHLAAPLNPAAVNTLPC